MSDVLRTYEPDRDLAAVLRMWLEVGWLERPEQRGALEAFIAAGAGEVAEVEGEAECMVHRSPGTLSYGPAGASLALCAITAVTTSPVARRKGFASTLTARALEHGVRSGAAVAALGMFEQGFYDRMGFGTGAYENEFSFDPGMLRVEHIDYRTPVRLAATDFKEIHQALAGRLKNHGAVCLDSPRFVEGEIGFQNKWYALGYRDEAGQLTHFLSGEMGGEYGPWKIQHLAYQTAGQLLELFRLLYELSDQIRSVKMMEPAHVQLQALLREPMRERDRSRNSPHSSEHRADAWMQLRILDLEACIEACRSVTPEVRFNLRLSDPLAGRGSWPGIGGDYGVVIGPHSSTCGGLLEGVPELRADVPSFSRLWLGVRPASTLAVTDQLHGPEELLAELDRAFLLPSPVAGLEF